MASTNPARHASVSLTVAALAWFVMASMLASCARAASQAPGASTSSSVRPATLADPPAATSITTTNPGFVLGPNHHTGAPQHHLIVWLAGSRGGLTNVAARF